MSSQFFPNRFDETPMRTAAVPVLVQAGAARRWVAAALDLLAVVGPLVWGVSALRDGSSLGWAGVGIALAVLIAQVVLPVLTARSLFMTAFGLQMLDLDTGEPARGRRTVVRHVWPPARGEVCDVREHVVAAARDERPSDAIVPPVGPTAVAPEQVSGALISQVPGATSQLESDVRPPAAAVSLAVPVAVPVAPTPVEESTVARPLLAPEGPSVVEHPGPWTLTFDTGEVVEVTGRLLLGRDPADGQGGARLLAIDDPQRSLSKTHAALRRAGDALVVEDLDSTNGVTVTRAGGDVPVVPRAPFQLERGDEVYFGQVRAVVSGGGAG